MKYALELRAYNGVANNTAVMTFADNRVDPSGAVAKRFAARLAVYHQGLTAFSVMAASEIVSIKFSNTVGATDDFENIGIDSAAYLDQLARYNADPDLSTLFQGGPVPANPVPGSLSGEQIALPIGTSIMITEVTPSFKGRCFVPFPNYRCLDAGNGRATALSRQILNANHRWLLGLTPLSKLDADNVEMGVFSKTRNVVETIQSISIRPEFSNLASRRR
jgi:hypothetical protein